MEIKIKNIKFKKVFKFCLDSLFVFFCTRNYRISFYHDVYNRKYFWIPNRCYLVSKFEHLHSLRKLNCLFNNTNMEATELHGIELRILFRKSV
jgi:hypothetical protein